MFEHRFVQRQGSSVIEAVLVGVPAFELFD